MNNITIGKKIILPVTELAGPLVIVGNTGQGKSVTLIQIILQCIATKQTGIMYDPYGDLAAMVMTHITSEASLAHESIITQEDFLAGKTASTPFYLVAGNQMQDGSHYTRQQAQAVVQKMYQTISDDGWIFVDQAFDFAIEDVFQYYIANHSIHTVLSTQNIIDLSETQRQRLFAKLHHMIIYKTDKADTQILATHFEKLSVENIATLELYHFYYMNDQRMAEDAGVWPLH